VGVSEGGGGGFAQDLEHFIIGAPDCKRFIWLGLKLYSLLFESNYAYSQTMTKFEIKI
jgi:hypothetical protein